MNKNVTSKEELVAAALEIAREEGVHKVSIRNIAHKCSISVGVLYNYFPTKADLIFAVVSHFWEMSSSIITKSIVTTMSSYIKCHNIASFELAYIFFCQFLHNTII